MKVLEIIFPNKLQKYSESSFFYDCLSSAISRHEMLYLPLKYQNLLSDNTYDPSTSFVHAFFTFLWLLIQHWENLLYVNHKWLKKKEPLTVYTDAYLVEGEFTTFDFKVQNLDRSISYWYINVSVLFFLVLQYSRFIL